MQLPTIRQLQFLVALADKGSFIAASEAVFVTQPSLSAGIKELEYILNAQLVERGRKGVKFTQAGKEVVAQSRAILAEMIDLKDRVRAASEPLTGSFRLGIIPTIAPFLSPNAIPLIKQRYPKIKLYLKEDQTARLIDGIKNNELDAALIALPYDATGIECLPLFDDEFLLICPKDHKLASKKDLTIQDINIDELLLLEDGHCLREHALGICGINQHPQSDEVRATSIFTLMQMVAGGLGISLIPKMAINAGLSFDGMKVRPFAIPVIGRQIGLAWRKGSSREKEAQILAKTLCAPEKINGL